LNTGILEYAAVPSCFAEESINITRCTGYTGNTGNAVADADSGNTNTQIASSARNTGPTDSLRAIVNREDIIQFNKIIIEKRHAMIAPMWDGGGCSVQHPLWLPDFTGKALAQST
jgi:hypothetical protein